MLKKLDADALEIVDLKNERRVNRALEICLSGKKYSESKKSGKELFDVLQIGLTLPREELNKKIDLRVDKMIKQGLVNETKKIIKNFGSKCVVLETIGYKEIVDYLNNVGTGRDLSKAIELIKIHTHQFAKRQMTWFARQGSRSHLSNKIKTSGKRDKKVKWIKNKSEAEKLIKELLKK